MEALRQALDAAENNEALAEAAQQRERKWMGEAAAAHGKARAEIGALQARAEVLDATVIIYEMVIGRHLTRSCRFGVSAAKRMKLAVSWRSPENAALAWWSAYAR